MRRLVLVHLLGCGVLVAPAAALAQSQAPAAAPAQAPAATEADTRSLFDPRANQMQIGGRFSSIDGDPARFQRYQDLRDGVLFTDAISRDAMPMPSGRVGERPADVSAAPDPSSIAMVPGSVRHVNGPME